MADIQQLEQTWQRLQGSADSATKDAERAKAEFFAERDKLNEMYNSKKAKFGADKLRLYFWSAVFFVLGAGLMWALMHYALGLHS
jgi:hypothetical protein